MKKGYKICPYCGEEIKEVAIKCRFCREFLNSEDESKKENYNKNRFIFTHRNLEEKDDPQNLGNRSKMNKITPLKRFGTYIWYVIRDWGIYLIFSAMTSGYSANPYSDSRFQFDMFVCFILFIIETVRLIKDLLKIKKGTFNK